MKNSTKIIIIICIILVLGILLYFWLRPKSNENFKISHKNNPFNSVFLIEFSKSKPDIIDYKLLHKKQQEHMKIKNKKENYIYEGLGDEDLNTKISDYLIKQQSAADDQDRVDKRELRFKTFGIPGTILGDVDGLKIRELITNTLGNIPDQLSSYLFQFLQTKKKKDLMIDLLRYVGITAISMTLAAVGLGPLSSLFKGFLPAEEDTSLNLADLEKSLTDSLYKERFITLSMNMNLNLQKVKYYMATVYLPLKVKYYASCNFDDESFGSEDIIKCLKENEYDPNITKKDPKENDTKRELLNISLKEMDRLMYSECTSIYSDILEIASNYNFGNSIEIAKLINNTNIQLILIEISYYQEKALADNFHKNSKMITNINTQIKDILDGMPGDKSKKDELLSIILPSCKASNYYYINPWLSKNIGNIDIIGTSGPQNSGLLQNIQKRCKEYFELIQKIIQLYYNNMEYYNDCSNIDFVRWVDHYTENIVVGDRVIHYKGEYKDKASRDNPLTPSKGNISNAVHFTLKKDLYLGDIRQKLWWERRNDCTTRSNNYTFINKNAEDGDDDYKLPLPDSTATLRIGNDTKRQAVLSDIGYYYTNSENTTPRENKIFYNNRKCGCLIDFVESMNFKDVINNFMEVCGISSLATLKNYFRTVDEVLNDIFVKDYAQYLRIYEKWGSYQVNYYEFGSSELKNMPLLPTPPTTPLPTSPATLPPTSKYALKNLPLYYLKCVFNKEDIFINADLRIKDLIDIILKFDNDKIVYNYNNCFPFGKRYGSYNKAKELYDNFKELRYKYNPTEIKDFGSYCSNPLFLNRDFDSNLQIKIPNIPNNYPGINNNIYCKQGNALVTCTNPFMSPGTEGTDSTRNRSIVCYNEFTGISIKNKDLASKFLEKFNIDNLAYGLAIKENKNIYKINIPNFDGKLEIPFYDAGRLNYNFKAKFDTTEILNSNFFKLELKLDEDIIKSLSLTTIPTKPIKPTEGFIERDKTFYMRNYEYLELRQKYYSDIQKQNDNIEDILFIQNLLNDKLFFTFKENGGTINHYFDIQNGYIIYLQENSDVIKSIKKIENNSDIFDELSVNESTVNTKCNTFTDIKVERPGDHKTNLPGFKSSLDNLVSRIISILNEISELFKFTLIPSQVNFVFLTDEALSFLGINTIKSNIQRNYTIINTLKSEITRAQTNLTDLNGLYIRTENIKKELDQNIKDLKSLYNNKVLESKSNTFKYQLELINNYIKYIIEATVTKHNRVYSISDEYIILRQPTSIKSDFVLVKKIDNGKLSFYNFRTGNTDDNTITGKVDDDKVELMIKEINNIVDIPLNINVEIGEDKKLKYRNLLDQSLTEELPSFTDKNYFEYYTPNYCRYKC